MEEKLLVKARNKRQIRSLHNILHTFNNSNSNDDNNTYTQIHTDTHRYTQMHTQRYAYSPNDRKGRPGIPGGKIVFKNGKS